MTQLNIFSSLNYTCRLNKTHKTSKLSHLFSNGVSTGHWKGGHRPQLVKSVHALNVQKTNFYKSDIL